MKKNYPVAIVSSILLLSLNCLGIGAVMATFGWFHCSVISFMIVLSVGIALLVLQLLIAKKMIN